MVDLSFNERGNVGLLYTKLSHVLSGLAWEMIVVDDNSPGGAAKVVDALSRSHGDVRCLRRFGRCGLASACVEGMTSTVAQFVASGTATGRFTDLRFRGSKAAGLLAQFTGRDLTGRPCSLVSREPQ